MVAGADARFADAETRFAGADTTLPRPGIRTSFKVYPSPLWSRSSGFAAGVGYEIRNLFMTRGRLLLTAVPGQHRGRYTATYFAKDAFTDPLFGLANIYYETAGRQWFSGLGPASRSGNKVAVEKVRLEGELRLGFQPLNRTLLFQPFVKYIRHESKQFRDWDDGAIGRLDSESLQNLEFATVGPSDGVQEGASYGLVAGIDMLDRPVRPRSGLLFQGSLQRFTFGSPNGLEFDQHEIHLYGFIPVLSGIIALRGVTVLTDQRGTTPIPFYLLPSLHGRVLPGYSWDRFFGPDLLALNVEYIYPLVDAYGLLRLDGLLAVGAGSVYEDLFDQFAAEITFTGDLERGRESYPLRPSITAGFDLYRENRTGFDLRVLVGLGTEGISLVRFAFMRDLRDVQLRSR